MRLKEKLIKVLGGLTEDEKKIVRSFLSDEAPEEPAQAEPEPTADDKQPAETAPAKDEPKAEPAQTEEPGNEQEAAPEDTAQQVEENLSQEQQPKPNAESEQSAEPEPTEEIPENEEIPQMVAGGTEPDETLTEEGQQEDMPVDYETIIDGLNAKNAALEAENAKLRAQTGGAFGLTSKPAGMAKVNPLYDNDVSDLVFKKIN